MHEGLGLCFGVPLPPREEPVLTEQPPAALLRVSLLVVEVVVTGVPRAGADAARGSILQEAQEPRALVGQGDLQEVQHPTELQGLAGGAAGGEGLHPGREDG